MRAHTLTLLSVLPSSTAPSESLLHKVSMRAPSLHIHSPRFPNWQSRAIYSSPARGCKGGGSLLVPELDRWAICTFETCRKPISQNRHLQNIGKEGSVAIEGFICETHPGGAAVRRGQRGSSRCKAETFVAIPRKPSDVRHRCVYVVSFHSSCLYACKAGTGKFHGACSA